jgi:hypothetical protein
MLEKFMLYIILRTGTSTPPIIFAILPTNALRAKNLKTYINFFASGIYRSYYVRGLQYMPPRVLALCMGPKPCGGNDMNPGI